MVKVKAVFRTYSYCINDITMYNSVACTYSGMWWTGNVIEKSDDNSDWPVKFMHPKGPSPTFQ
jgi:hypothetical protein